ncbi:unnamed protein product, partial [Dicrocoelium dendriticum]
ITKRLQQLRAKGYITVALYDSLRPCGTNVPRLYGLPKVHKADIPLRPILSMVNSPYHAIAQWLVGILESVRQQLVTYSLRDSFQFVESIQEAKSNEKGMLSFDVVSLFTSVPLIETIDYICEQITKLEIKICIPVLEVKNLLLRCTCNVQFPFNG